MDKLEKLILRDLVEYSRGERSRPNHTEYEMKHKGSLRARNEYAYYLNNLKESEYLRFDDSKVIHPGGIRDLEYKNSVSGIFIDNIVVTDKAKRLFKPRVQKIGESMTNEFKELTNDVKNDVRGHFSKWIAGFIVLLVFATILKFLNFFG